jgi:ubiquinone/menaquinone biosynthesis C-methylase UbiE
LTTQHGGHRRFPGFLGFMLDNPIRRFLSPPGQIISKLNVGSKDTVVDFGCGTGFFTIPLAKIAERTIGIDVSSKMLVRAAENVRKNGFTAEFLESDGTEIKLENESIDFVLLVHVFHEVNDKPRVLREFSRILKRSGRLVIVEKTRGAKRFSGVLGPPVVDEREVVQEVERTGFSYVETIPRGKDGIIISKKRIP